MVGFCTYEDPVACGVSTGEAILADNVLTGEFIMAVGRSLFAVASVEDEQATRINKDKVKRKKIILRFIRYSLNNFSFAIR